MDDSESRRVARQSWVKFLDPESLRFSLTVGAVYLTAYEFLVQALVDRLRSFFTIGWTSDGAQTDPDYSEKVLSRHSMPYFASADWYVEMGALNVHDIAALRRVREHRNFVAHHIPDIVMSSGVEVEPERLADIINLVAKLDRWWLRYVEVSCNPEFDGKEFSEKDFDEAFSMRMYNLHLLISFVSGDERPLREMHTTFKDVWPIQEE